jgi:hypothetical protein
MADARYEFRSTAGSDKGKRYTWSYRQLADTLFESDGWDTKAVAKRVQSLKPGASLRGKGGILTRKGNLTEDDFDRIDFEDNMTKHRNPTKHFKIVLPFMVSIEEESDVVRLMDLRGTSLWKGSTQEFRDWVGNREYKRLLRADEPYTEIKLPLDYDPRSDTVWIEDIWKGSSAEAQKLLAGFGDTATIKKIRGANPGRGRSRRNNPTPPVSDARIRSLAARIANGG